AASNTPFSSFADYGGLSDAINNNMGRVFTTLGTYFRAQADMYTPAGVVVGGPLPIPVWPGPSGNGHPLEVDMAGSLASAINDEWAALTADKVNNLMDYHDPTEIMRRVSGFLSIVNGLLQPL